MALLALLSAGAARGSTRNVSCGATSTGLDFAVYNPLQTAPSPGVGSVLLTCRIVSGRFGRAVASVALTAGNSGNFGARQMRFGSNGLNYNLYWDAAHSQVAGDGTGGSIVGGPFRFRLNRRAPDQTQPVYVYGLMPPRQDVAPGNYRDLIVVTISY